MQSKWFENSQLQLFIWLERIIVKSFSPVFQNNRILFPRFIRASVPIITIIIVDITLNCFFQIIADMVVHARNFERAQVCTLQVNCKAAALTSLSFCVGTGT